MQKKPESLIGGVDWITKKWLLETFMEEEKIEWGDPWLQSLDLEYHNIDPEKGLFFGVTPPKRIGEWNDRVRRNEATLHSAGKYPRVRSRARGRIVSSKRHHPYVINWDSIACDSRDFLVMGDPFNDYNEEVGRFLSRAGFTPID